MHSTIGTKAQSVLMLAGSVLSASMLTHAQLPRDTEQPGVSGYVLAPDGTPVSDGRVTLTSPVIAGTASSIERTGRFRLIPSLPGDYRLVVTVPDLAPYRVSVAVPPSRALKLPVIRLTPATYFRARFVTDAGEPITGPSLRRVSLDGNARPVPGPVESVESDGAITLGPLPQGITILALDSPPFAQTRLPDITVTGAEMLLDGGTVTIQPGAVLNVDVVDGSGAPVPNHLVFLEDSRSPSPLGFDAPRTDRRGRATFERLGEGRYRLRAGVTGLCGNRQLSIARLVPVPGRGTLLTRLIVGGHATFRMTSSGTPLRGATITATPDAAVTAAPAGRRSSSGFPPFGGPPGRLEAGCAGTTDDNGRVTLRTFPPGPARVDVPLQHSMYVQRVNVPEDGSELAIAIPDGFLAVRVIGAVGNQPVAGAVLSWLGGGARVEATTVANGEALLEGVGPTRGTLMITAPGYESAQVSFAESPGVLQEVALVPAPVTGLQLRVVTTSGEPVPQAVVELSSGNPIDVAQVAVTDAKGVVRFPDAPPGALRLVASADGLVTAGMRVASDRRDGLTLALSRGHRVVVGVELSAGAGPYLVRVANETGVSMERFLDGASDRSFTPPGWLSLGPLAPGAYLIELLGPRDRREHRVHIVDGDVVTTVR